MTIKTRVGSTSPALVYNSQVHHQWNRSSSIRQVATSMSPSLTPVLILLVILYGNFPVEVPLSWFWKCVLIATTTDNGAQVDWFDVMTNPPLTGRLQCPNVELDTPKEVTLHRHLQFQWDIYTSDDCGKNVKPPRGRRCDGRFCILWMVSFFILCWCRDDLRHDGMWKSAPRN